MLTLMILFFSWLFIVAIGQFFNMLINPIEKRTKFKNLALVALVFAIPFTLLNTLL